jgi:hypothetical protein
MLLLHKLIMMYKYEVHLLHLHLNKLHHHLLQLQLLLQLISFLVAWLM